jgi:hypothetical protein
MKMKTDSPKQITFKGISIFLLAALWVFNANAHSDETALEQVLKVHT